MRHLPGQSAGFRLVKGTAHAPDSRESCPSDSTPLPLVAPALCLPKPNKPTLAVHLPRPTGVLPPAAVPQRRANFFSFYFLLLFFLLTLLVATRDHWNLVCASSSASLYHYSSAIQRQFDRHRPTPELSLDAIPYYSSPLLWETASLAPRERRLVSTQPRLDSSCPPF